VNAPELLAELQGRGMRLEAIGGRLRYDAPKGALTPELRRAMAEHKAELLGLVEQHLRTQATDLVAVA
jgi:pyochelin synthetase